VFDVRVSTEALCPWGEVDCLDIVVSVILQIENALRAYSELLQNVDEHNIILAMYSTKVNMRKITFLVLLAGLDSEQLVLSPPTLCFEMPTCRCRSRCHVCYTYTPHRLSV
jgi:hypothetical protein